MKPWSLAEISQVIGAPFGASGHATGISTDTRSIKPGDLFVALVGEQMDGHQYVPLALEKGAIACVCARPVEGVSQSQLALVADTKVAYLELAAAYRRGLRQPIVGVTGSVGKTTTKEMIAAALGGVCKVYKTPENLNNEIGVSQTIFATPETDDIAVLELGIDRPGDMALLSHIAKPDVAVVTNVGVVHLEYLLTRENIRREKLDILREMEPGTPIILNGDNDMLAEITEIADHPVLRYGIKNPDLTIRAVDLAENITEYTTSFTILDGESRFFCQIPLLGNHHVENALAAYGVVKVLGLDVPACLAGLMDYAPVGMRQRITHHGGVTFIEDCYNAGPESTKAALHLLGKMKPETGGRRVTILGDMRELGVIEETCHRDLAHQAFENGVDLSFFCGPLTRFSQDEAEQLGLLATHQDDQDLLAQEVLASIKPGDLVLVKASRRIGLEKVLQKLYTFLDSNQ